jgi:PAS domain S-box-containing protein
MIVATDLRTFMEYLTHDHTMTSPPGDDMTPHPPSSSDDMDVLAIERTTTPMDESHFQALFEGALDAMLVVDDLGTYRDINSAGCELLGLCKAKLLNQRLANFVEADENFEQSWQHFLQTERLRGEFCLHRSDGVLRTVEFSATANFSPGHHLLILRDVTDRKQAEFKTQQTTLSEQQAFQRERLIAAITQNIRQSLDLDYILTTTAEEVQQFLQVDRVVIYRINENGTGKIIAEAIEEEEFSILNWEIEDPCFQDATLQSYRQGRIHTINDIQTAGLDPCYQALLSKLRVRAALAVPILVQQNLWGLMIAHQCTSPRQWQAVNWQVLLQLNTQLAIGIHQAELYQQTQQQAQKEYALNQMIQVIRSSLDLTTIFSAVTLELGQLLRVDRAEILQYLPEQERWLNIASYRKTPDLPDTLGLTVPAAGIPFAAQLQRLEIVRVNSHSPAALTLHPPFPQVNACAWLLIPMQVGEVVWGSLCLSHSEQPWQWQDWQVELAQAVASQLAIAIQQSELYQAVQRLNNDLERQVEDRTAQLRQVLDFEELLKRITDNVRDSLDESQILQTVVRELTLGLELSGCDVAIYDAQRNASFIRYEYLRDRDLPSGQGQLSTFTSTTDFSAQLSQGLSTQFCLITPDPIRNAQRRYAILACPILNEQDFWGTLWLFRYRQDTFSPAEIRLIQQVTNQCAIALRQSRLYQAAQAQVEELGKLNRMKDHFLSTVSHELRTPMSSIKMAIEMLEITLLKNQSNHHADESIQLPPNVSQRVDRYFKILQKECDREIDLINNLLDLSRLEAEIEPIKLSKINLLTWLPEIIQPFAEQAQKQGQTLHLHLPKQLPTLTTDPAYLERIFTELLTNACKYTPTGESITLSAQVIGKKRRTNTATTTPPMLTISILNTGVEIPPQELPRIFEKFHRIVSSDPWKHSGTGLGLALVKKLADLLGCTIRAESQSGETRFILQFAIEGG